MAKRLDQAFHISLILLFFYALTVLFYLFYRAIIPYPFLGPRAFDLDIRFVIEGELPDEFHAVKMCEQEAGRILERPVVSQVDNRFVVKGDYFDCRLSYDKRQPEKWQFERVMVWSRNRD